MSAHKRDSLVDLLKGIGIISVVIGHSGVLFPGLEFIPNITFVYLYHLMVFFFAAGMVYRPEKYTDPYTYIGRQLKAAVPLYVLYNFALLLLHNLFSTLQLTEQPIFHFNDFIVQGISIFTLNYTEPLAGALWFVPMFLFSKAFFCIAFQFAERFGRFKWFAHAALFLLTAFLGLYTNKSGMFFTYHLQTAILGVPILYLGYFFQKLRTAYPIPEKVGTILHPVLCLASAAFLFWFLSLQIGFVELSINNIITARLFYPITAVGLLFCVSLASVLQRSKRCTALISYLGSISFHIMALHFVVFKVFDRIFGALTGADVQFFLRFPTGLSNYGLLYTLLGLAVPALLVFLFRLCKQKLQNARESKTKKE